MKLTREDYWLRLEEKYDLFILEEKDGIMLVRKNKYYYYIKKDTISSYKYSFCLMTKESKIRYIRENVIIPNNLRFEIIDIDKDFVCLKNSITNITTKQSISDVLNNKNTIKRILSITERKYKTEEKIKATLGDFYNYDKLDFIDSREKVCITCPEHGDFYVTPSNILCRSIGCPKCSYEKKQFGKPGFMRNCKNGIGMLYIIRLFNETESFYKIGITSKDVEYRFKRFPYSLDIIKTHQDCPERIYELEKILHNEFKNNKYIPSIYFNGLKECFNTINLERINELILIK